VLGLFPSALTLSIELLRSTATRTAQSNNSQLLCRTLEAEQYSLSELAAPGQDIYVAENSDLIALVRVESWGPCPGCRFPEPDL